MKKFYSTIALACAVGVSAFAASPVSDAPVKKAFDGVQSIDAAFVAPSGLIKAAKTVKAPAKVAASVEDIEGFYSVDYESMFTSGAKDATTAQITAVSEDQILIQMEPYCSSYSNITMDPLIASYDASTGTITVSVADNSQLGQYTQTSSGTVYNLELNVFNRVPNPNDPGKYMAEELDELVGVVQADGSIKMGEDNTCFGFQLVEMPGSYVGGFMGATFVAPDFFKYNAAEWESAGDALFTEDWMNLWLYDEEPEYVLQPRNIPLMKNKENSYMYLVQNPFKVNNWMNEDPDADGYLVFYLDNAQLVPMRPLTPSGLWLTIQTGGFPQQLYIYNMEGYYVTNQGYDPAELLELFLDNDMVPSDFDAATKTVTLRNICFGYTDNPGGSTYYPSIEDGVYKITSDALQAGGSGVNNIVTDESNGPKRFFNLQGVEISNPANGEIVIVKEGNKTSKVVVR